MNTKQPSVEKPGYRASGRIRASIQLHDAQSCMADDESASDGEPPNPSDSSSTSELIERARRGNAEAVEQLFARHLKPLQRWASGRLPKWARDLADTDDLVQDTLLQTFKRIEAFEPRRVGALHAYLRQAVLNRIRDELRRKGRQPEATELDGLELAATVSPLEEAIGQRGRRQLRASPAGAETGGARGDHRPDRDGLQLRGIGERTGQADAGCCAEGGTARARAAGRGNEAWPQVAGWRPISPARFSTARQSTGNQPSPVQTRQCAG